MVCFCLAPKDKSDSEGDPLTKRARLKGKMAIMLNFSKYEITQFYSTRLERQTIPIGRTQITVKCPFHDDQKPSLSINLDTGQFYCHGCGKNGDIVNFEMEYLQTYDFPEVLRSLERLLGRPFENDDGLQQISSITSLRIPLLKTATPEKKPKPRVIKEELVETYTYRDEQGNILFYKDRYKLTFEDGTTDKDFKQYRVINGEKILSLGDVRRVLYKLPELLTSDKEEPIFLCAGEKDVNRLRVYCMVATTNTEGEGKWNSEYNEAFRNRTVYILVDNDPTGKKRVDLVSKELRTVGCRIKVIELPGLPEKGDVSDWLESGHSTFDLFSFIDSVPFLESSTGIQITEQRPTEPSFLDDNPWPAPMGERAFYGLAGDFVQLIEPHSEADPVALLIHFQVMFGNVIGRTIHYKAEADQHYTNLFCAIIGETSKGRKGSAEGHPRRLLQTVDKDWVTRSGLNSGEGLIWNVRDPEFTTQQVIDKGIATGFKEVVHVEGVEDKRLMVIEPEFPGTLSIMSRPGNSLSATVRQAWDTGMLSTLTKNSPTKATDAHISIIGHGTREEILRNLNNSEASNGFANRFLFFCCRRSKCLPDGGNLSQEDTTTLLERIKSTIEWCKSKGKLEIKRDDEAREMWHAVYPELSEGKPGLLGSMIARAEAQTMRLATLYAALDMSELIRAVHLEAALTVWEYAEASCRYVFSGRLGDPTADTLLSAIRASANGMTRTDIRDLFARNKSQDEVQRALGVLHQKNLVTVVHEGADKGRPTERWIFKKA